MITSQSESVQTQVCRIQEEVIADEQWNAAVQQIQVASIIPWSEAVDCHAMIAAVSMLRHIRVRLRRPHFADPGHNSRRSSKIPAYS